MKFLLPLLSAFLFLGCAAQKKYQSLFWEISGNGLTESSYLYGTMHVQDERVFDFKDGVLSAFDNANTYAMELNMDSINPTSIMGDLIMDSSITLKDLVSVEDYISINNYFRDTLKMPLIMFESMQPLFTASMISQREFGSEMNEALDMHLFNKAKQQGKSTIGLEKMEEQLSAFNSIPYKEQAQGLVELVKGNAGDFSESDMLEHYINGDLDKLLEITHDESTADFNKVFLTDRNIKMTNRSIEYIVKESTFIAIGAAHLPGEDGVIELLRAKGYQVSAK